MRWFVVVLAVMGGSALEGTAQVPQEKDKKKDVEGGRFHSRQGQSAPPKGSAAPAHSCPSASAPIGAPDDEQEFRDGQREAFLQVHASTVLLFAAPGLVFLAALIGVFLSRRRVDAFDKKSTAPVEPDRDDDGRYRIR